MKFKIDIYNEILFTVIIIPIICQMLLKNYIITIIILTISIYSVINLLKKSFVIEDNKLIIEELNNSNKAIDIEDILYIKIRGYIKLIYTYDIYYKKKNIDNLDTNTDYSTLMKIPTSESFKNQYKQNIIEVLNRDYKIEIKSSYINSDNKTS